MYKKLDSLVLDKLRKGPLLFLFVFSQEVRAEASRIAELSGRECYRVVDGRLQALRKRGLIVFTHGKGWALKLKEPS